MRKITKLFQDMVLSRRSVTIGDVAEWLDKAPSTIYGMLNPQPQEGRHEKLGLEEAFVIADNMNDYTPFIKALNERGFTVERADKCCEPITSENIYKEMADVVSKVGRLSDRVRESMSDNRLTDDELIAILKESLLVDDELKDIIVGIREARQTNGVDA